MILYHPDQTALMQLCHTRWFIGRTFTSILYNYYYKMDLYLFKTLVYHWQLIDQNNKCKCLIFFNTQQLSGFMSVLWIKILLQGTPGTSTLSGLKVSPMTKINLDPINDYCSHSSFTVEKWICHSYCSHTNKWAWFIFKFRQQQRF